MNETIWILTYKKECNSTKYTVETYPSEELVNYRVKELKSQNIEYNLRHYKMQYWL